MFPTLFKFIFLEISCLDLEWALKCYWLFKDRSSHDRARVCVCVGGGAVLMPDWRDSPVHKPPDVLPCVDMPLILGFQTGR